MISKDLAEHPAEPYAFVPAPERVVTPSVSSHHNRSDSQALRYPEQLTRPILTPVKAKVKPKEGTGKNVDTPANKKPKYVQIRDYILDRYELRFNTVGLDIESRKKDGKGTWEVCEIEYLKAELFEVGFTGFQAQLDTILKSQCVPKFDPIRHYMESLPTWDKQTDYIRKFASYVKATDQEFFEVQFKKMLVRMISQAFGAISFNKQCFTFVSGQNDGKTSFFESLVKDTPLWRYYKQNPDITGKESKRALAENFLLNLDELSALSRQDINQVKATFSESQIKVRLPYDRKDVVMPRKASFVGSTNNREFLTDETGNVRWLVFHVLSIQHDKGGPKGYMSVGVHNVWVQAYSLFLAGFDCQLTREEIEHSERNNEQFSLRSSESQLLAQYFSPCDIENGAKFYQPINLVTRLMELTGGKLNFSPERIGRALTKMGVEKVLRGPAKCRISGYYLKENLLGTDELPTGF